MTRPILPDSDAHGQGIHADATREGFTILRAMERTQYLVVVLHGFHAMRILDELREDRTAATNLLRATLHTQASPRTFSDKEWCRVESEGWTGAQRV